MRLPLAIPAVLAICLAVPAASAQDYVVTDSTAAAFGPGRMLGADAPISLAAGERLTLIGPAGPVSIDGPFEGVVSAAAGTGAGSGTGGALAALASRRERLLKIGAARGEEAKKTGAGAFNVLVDRALCVGAGKPPKLFAPPADAPRIISLVSSAGAAEIFWPAKAASADWPDAAPFRAGLSYKVMVGDVEMPGEIAMIDGPPPGPKSGRIAEMIAAGCFAQAEAALGEPD